jgi:hypothetical protein
MAAIVEPETKGKYRFTLYPRLESPFTEPDDCVDHFVKLVESMRNSESV